MSKKRKGTEPNPIALMQALRKKGWCVVLKCLPKDVGWLLEGSRSEFDAPCPNKRVGKGKWYCEAQSIRRPLWRSQWAMDKDPAVAVQQVWDAIKRKAK